MRVISKRRLREYALGFPRAAPALALWLSTARKSQWDNLMEVRRDFPSADGVIVGSGKVVTVFNIGGNKYRLITAIHYNTAKIHVMRLLTHAQYTRKQWVQIL